MLPAAVPAYRALLKSAFAMAAADDVGAEEAHLLVKREQAGRVLLGLDVADRLVQEEAAEWQRVRGTCPWCGGRHES